jgi:uncharacterized protein
VSAVFLDSVGLIALWDESDQWHSAALAAYELLESPRRKLVTTRFVMLECGNAAQRRPYRGDVVQMMQWLERRGGLYDPTNQDWYEAWAAYERGRPGDPGIVDCISFVVMRRLGLTEAFTNDQHFAAAGFKTLF